MGPSDSEGMKTEEEGLRPWLEISGERERERERVKSKERLIF